LALAIVVTGAHFIDNARAIRIYPEPGWITRPDIAVSWIAMTAIGVAGYVLYRRGRAGWGAAMLYAYALLAGAGVLHYRYAPASHFTPWMHALIAGEALAALALISITTWALAHRA
jgi:hypothetical protein